MRSPNKFVYVCSFLISCIALNGFAIDFLSSKTTIDSKSTDRKELLIFSATWCPPCKLVKAELSKSNSELSKVVSGFDVKKYDYDLDKREFNRYNVSRVPTFIVRNNEDQNRMVGIGRGIRDLINFLKKHE